MFKSNNKPSRSHARSKMSSIRNITVMIIALGMSTMAMADSRTGFISKANLPTNANATCVADVASWFPGGKVSKNGWVKPANGLDPIFADFNNNTRCDFYKWGAQMFLWMTSGFNTKHVFNASPGFYNVSVEENSQRTFETGDGTMLLAVRKGKTDKEIELGQAGGGDVLLSQNNSLVYYGLHANNVFALYTTGQKKKAFNDVPGWISAKEDAACLAQFESCASEIAGFCKEQLNYCTHNNFPSTPAQINAVSKFASAYGYPLSDPEAMAIELKTSWIDANKVVGNKDDYILTQAVVPVFNPSAPEGPWPVTGNEEKNLAMVGMHVVGTVNGHPEMIWSTFEHVNNVPDNTYVYTTNIIEGADFKNATQPYKSSGKWNFLASNAPAPASITANAKVKTAFKGTSPVSIVNIGGAPIAPIDVLRVDPWGNQHGDDSSSNVSNNTGLVSINVSVLSQLKAGDIRGNYIQTGGVWTAEGQIPSDGTSENLRGSLNLANTTMETFYQFHNSAPGAFNPKNCFGCHGSTYVIDENGSGATGVSHIFGALQALPKK